MDAWKRRIDSVDSRQGKRQQTHGGQSIGGVNLLGPDVRLAARARSHVSPAASSQDTSA